jgi:hypothetical protein
MRAMAQQRAATLARTRRRNQQPTGIKGVVAKLPVVGSSKRGKSSSSNPLQGIVSSLPVVGGGKKSRKSSSGGGAGKRAGGAALVAGAAGLAIKNREKITSMIGGGGSKHEHSAQTDTTTVGPDAEVSRLDVSPGDVTTPSSPGTPG